MPRTLVALLALSMAACGTNGAATTTTSPTTTTVRPTTTTTSPPTTTTGPTTTTQPAQGGRTIVLPVVDQLSSRWLRAFVIPYGETPETLGTSLGGDGEGILIGPDYGARAPDGSWWILDGAKRRLAQFSAGGQYLGQVEVPAELLASGGYFQYQLPRVLDDGTVLANSANLSGSTLVLRLRGDELDTVAIPGEWIPRYDDGEVVYAFSFEDELLAVDAVAGTAEVTEWFTTRAGERFRLTIEPGRIAVELPDVPIEVVIPVEAPPEVGGTVYVSAEVVSTVDGTLHLFLLGFTDADDSVQLGGYLTIGPNGVQSAVEPVRDPFSEADPGSPSRLGVRPGSNEVSLMFIDDDGVRVYYRSR